MSWLIEIQRWLYGGMSEGMKANPDLTAIPAFMVAAFVFGMVHALMPGHGKSVLVSYHLGRKSRLILNLAIWFALHVFFKEVTVIMTGPLTLWTPTLSSLDFRVVVLSALSGYLLLGRHWSIPPVLAMAAGLSLAIS